ncbi:MAG: chemotaxis protein CheW [Ruminiclostridium sp.]|nr:chemotaxis protein CheW [Ruminiclostridium sp.]
MEEIKKSIGGDMPWIIFNLCQNKFAVCSDMISGMTELPSEIVPVPTANKALRGVGVIRGQIVPLIDLREFFNMRSLDAEYEEFKEMLEQRKQEHINWANELKRCLETGEKFTLATDPHECKFGKWIDSYTSNRNDLNAHVAHISKPHSKLHKIAEEIFRDDISETDKEELLYEADIFYLPKILNLIDEGKELFKSNFRGIVLLVQPKETDKMMGLICDEVYSVEEADVVLQGNTLRRIYSSPYICGIAHTERVEGEIVMLDAKKMMNLYPDIEFELPEKKEEELQAAKDSIKEAIAEVFVNNADDSAEEVKEEVAEAVAEAEEVKEEVAEAVAEAEEVKEEVAEAVAEAEEVKEEVAEAVAEAEEVKEEIAEAVAEAEEVKEEVAEAVAEAEEVKEEVAEAVAEAEEVKEEVAEAPAKEMKAADKLKQTRSQKNSKRGKKKK